MKLEVKSVRTFS